MGDVLDQRLIRSLLTTVTKAVKQGVSVPKAREAILEFASM